MEILADPWAFSALTEEFFLYRHYRHSISVPSEKEVLIAVRSGTQVLKLLHEH